MTMQERPDSSWQLLAAVLRDGEFGLTATYPESPRKLSLLEALGNEDVAVGADNARLGQQIGDQLQSLLDQLSVFEDISRCPILAITGMLNSGKSSLLATYLSIENRPRVLRGTDNRAGTHRFVLWLPKVWWEDSSLLNTLVGFISSLFGHAPERLSSDPEEAAMQYNGRIFPTAMLHPGPLANETATLPLGEHALGPHIDPHIDPLTVPLLAYDAALDPLRIGLLDCPDIQTGFLAFQERKVDGDGMALSRRQQLARIGRLCSAFIVVTRMNSLHDEGLLQILTALRDAMPGVPRLLAVNKIKARYAPETVAAETRGLVQRFGVEAVYGAYDYRSSLAATRVPPPPPEMQLDDPQQPVKYPVFFELPNSLPNSRPNLLPHAPQPKQLPANLNPAGTSTAPLRYLFDLGQRLDAGALSRASSRSLVVQLAAKAQEAVSWLETNQQQRSVQIGDAWQAVASACFEFMVERDNSGQPTGLRLQASPAIVAQMASSLQRTAPLWMRASLSIDRTARQFQQAISNSAARFKILQSASQAVTQFTKKFRRGEGAQVVTPQRLADAIRLADIHDAARGTTQDHLVQGCELAMKRFADEDKTRLEASDLDEWSRQVWGSMSWRDKLWKGTQPLAVVMAPLLAAVLVPIDGGGTAVLVFASTKELLAAAGIAALVTPMATGGEALRIVQRETPWRQLSDLFAITCDSLGLPRPRPDELPSAMCDGKLRSLVASKLGVKPCVSRPTVFQWRSNTQQLRNQIVKLPLAGVDAP